VLKKGYSFLVEIRQNLKNKNKIENAFVTFSHGF
jgi:hypothetical protein